MLGCVFECWWGGLIVCFLFHGLSDRLLVCVCLLVCLVVCFFSLVDCVFAIAFFVWLFGHLLDCVFACTYVGVFVRSVVCLVVYLSVC